MSDRCPLGYLFVYLFGALRPDQQFFSYFVMASWVYPVLINGDEVSCSRTQHHAPDEDRTCDLAIKSPTLQVSQLSYRCSLRLMVVTELSQTIFLSSGISGRLYHITTIHKILEDRHNSLNCLPSFLNNIRCFSCS